jgi:PhnB protein
MSNERQQAYPTITPYLLYEDVPAAIDWLSRAFGFRERLRFAGKDGTVSHAEIELGDGTIMLGDPGSDYRNPNRLGAVTQYVHVYVDEVDAHYKRAKSAGATISSEPKDQEYGDRSYSVRDLEGHAWTFAQHVREVAPEEWGATVA